MPLRDFLSVEHPLRRAYRRLVAGQRVRFASSRSPSPAVAIYFPLGGLGDDLLGTAVAPAIHRHFGKPAWALSRHPELFHGNPDIGHVLAPSDETAAVLESRGVMVLRSRYTENRDGGRRHASPPEHIIAVVGRRLNLGADLDLRPRFYPSAEELAAANFAEGSIVLQSSGGSARFPIPTKEWLPGRFAQLAASLSERRPLIQIGAASDPLLPGVRDLRGRTGIRQTAAVLARARLFVGLVGFPMHLARAVDCPAVIVYGGREAPWQSGYIANENIYQAPPCAPCWLVDGCTHNWQCMADISADRVLAAIHSQLQRPRNPLAVETIRLTSAR